VARLEMDDSSGTSTVEQHPQRSRHVARIVGVVVLLAILVAVTLDNRHDVRVGWVIGNGHTPLALVVVLAALGGAAIGWLVLHWPRRSSDRSSS